MLFTRWKEIEPKLGEKCRRIECPVCGLSYIVSLNVPFTEWVLSDNKRYCGKCGTFMLDKPGGDEECTNTRRLILNQLD